MRKYLFHLLVFISTIALIFTIKNEMENFAKKPIFENYLPNGKVFSITDNPSVSCDDIENSIDYTLSVKTPVLNDIMLSLVKLQYEENKRLDGNYSIVDFRIEKIRYLYNGIIETYTSVKPKYPERFVHTTGYRDGDWWRNIVVLYDVQKNGLCYSLKYHLPG
ncbi:MAG TPA: hypothetical protein PK299_14920 [Anaerolineales bacterium]|nr:hypothetical protein [Anaerolineales bacterium]